MWPAWWQPLMVRGTCSKLQTLFSNNFHSTLRTREVLRVKAFQALRAGIWGLVKSMERDYTVFLVRRARVNRWTDPGGKTAEDLRFRMRSPRSLLDTVRPPPDVPESVFERDLQGILEHVHVGAKHPLRVSYRGSHPKASLGLDKALSCLSSSVFPDLPVATNAAQGT